MADAFTPTLVSFPHRAHIITNTDAVSIKGLGTIVAMLGAISVPEDFRSARAFRKTIEIRYAQE